MKAPDWYFKSTRREMLDYVPQSTNTLIDVGCGEGNFAAAIKKKLNAEVWGIEINRASAFKASKKIDKVLIGDANEILPTIKKHYFDCIVFNDILEHLVDPFTILRKSKELLTANGVIVLSVPNVLYISNLYRLLLFKDWKYVNHGVLDVTHLRFFSKKSLKNRLIELGFDIIRLDGINPYRSILFGIFNIFTFGHFNETQYLQFVCVAKPKQHTLDSNHIHKT